MTYYTIRSAAAELRCSHSTVSRRVEAMRLGSRAGGVVVLTADDVERLREVVRAGPGNPNFGTAAMAAAGVKARKARRKPRKK